MELRLTVESIDNEFAITQTNSLKKWISNEKSEIKVTQLKKKLQPDDASPEIMQNSLYIILNAQAIIILAKSLHTWIRERTKQKKDEIRKISISIESSDGNKFLINSQNAGETEEEMIRYLTDNLNNK